MSYLITQIFILLLLAALLGMVLGWYLSRISAAAARASLQARLKNAEADARELRSELDVAVNARGSCESERKALADELAALKVQAATATDPAPASAVQAEIEPEPEPEPEPETGSGAPVEAASAPAPQGLVDAAGALPPARLDPDDDTADDLQRIKGIGPKIAGILKELGIVHFEQIAEWSPENVAWVNARLRFKGRIEREEWIPQARALIAARDPRG